MEEKEGKVYHLIIRSEELVATRSLKSQYAVSYTHLRAHETVLDLVCRLLLEKKKDIISIILLSTQSNQLNQIHRVNIAL